MSRWRCARNTGGPEPATNSLSAVTRVGAPGANALDAPMTAAAVSAGTPDAMGPSAGPLVVAVRPQQSRAEGSETGPSQCPAQQLSARSSAATTAGFAYAVC